MNENSTISNAYDGKHDEYGHDLPRWMNFEHVIDIGEADPTQTATDYYGFELPNGVAMVIQSQPSHRDHPFIVYSYGDGACFHDDVEFDSLRTAISYASQGKSLGAKAASARGASEKLDGQTQAAPAKDNLEH